MSPHPDGKPPPTPPQPRPKPAFDIAWLNYIRTTWYAGRAYMRVLSLATRPPIAMEVCCQTPGILTGIEARPSKRHTRRSALTSNQKATQRTTRLQDKLAYQASNSLGNIRSQVPRLGLMHLLGHTPRCEDLLDHGQEALPRTCSSCFLREADLSVPAVPPNPCGVPHCLYSTAGGRYISAQSSLHVLPLLSAWTQDPLIPSFYIYLHRAPAC
jgi:hypothetical protein